MPKQRDSDNLCPLHNEPRSACICPRLHTAGSRLRVSEESEESNPTATRNNRKALQQREGSEESEESARKRKVVRGIRLDTIKPRATHWLIDQFIPLNSFSVLAGREGLGKSTLAIEWASQATRGKLQGNLLGQPVNVAYIASEDSPEQTLAPRFQVAGADTERVFLPYVFDNVTQTQRPLSFPRDYEALVEYVRANDIRLVIIDPVPSVLDDKLDSYKDSSIRQALDKLTELAHKGELTVLGLLHVGKSDSADFNNRVLGSRAFTAVPRAVLGLARDNQDSTGEGLLVGVTKSNLGSLNVPLKLFRVVSAELQAENGLAVVGRIEWLGEREGRIDDLLDTRISEEELITQDEQTTFLVTLLESHGGTITATEGKEALRKAGYKVTDYELDKAKKRAGIKAKKNGTSHWDWILENSPSKQPDSFNSSEPSRRLKESTLQQVTLEADSSEPSLKATLPEELRTSLDEVRPNCEACHKPLSLSDVECSDTVHGFCSK